MHPYNATLEERLERWYSDRTTNQATLLADWERDRAFLAIAVTQYPADIELARLTSYKAQSARQRLRLRWEGFHLMRNARQQMQALADASQILMAELDGQHPGVLAELREHQFAAIDWWLTNEDGDGEVPAELLDALESGALIVQTEDSVELSARGEAALEALRELRS
jgi:hypothetical protein